MIRLKRPFAVSFTALAASCALMMAGYGSVLSALILILSVLLLIFTFRRSPVCRVLLILIIFSLTGLLSFSLTDMLREKENALTSYGKEVSGTVTEIVPDGTGGIKSAILSDCVIDNTRIYSKLRIYPDKDEYFCYGDTVRLTADEVFISEGEGIFRFHTLSDRCHLACKYQAEKSTAEKTENSIRSLILEFKAYSSKRLGAALSEDAFAVSQALFTGSRDALSSELSFSFRTCGITHIFAVSGMHLSLWTGMFFIFFRKRARLFVIPNLLAIIFVLFYTAFTGFSPSVLRAGIMLITVFTGRIIRRKSDPLNTLFLSGTVLLAVNPYLAGNVSFLLSFIATGAMSFWSEYLLPARKSFSGLFRRLKNKIISPYYDVITSFSVMLTTLPVVSMFFGYFSLLSPIASIAVTPLAEAVMILSSVLVLIPSGTGLYSVMSLITEYACLQLTDTVGRLSAAEFMLIPADTAFVLPLFIIAALLCAVFIGAFRKRGKALIGILVSLMIFLSLTAYDYLQHRDETEITVFGRENATLISVTADGGANSLIFGAGGSFTLASEFTGYLGSKGIASTNLLFIPRDKPSENKNAEYFADTFLPDETVLCHQYPSGVSISLWDSCRLYGQTTEEFSAAAIYIGSTKIVICPLPSSEFTQEHSEFLSGDILICRSNIPETLDTDAFSDVIIVNDTYKEHLSEFTQTSTRNITITVKGASYAVS